MTRARITVTLPEELVRAIDRRQRNRSRFVLQAVERELEHRRRQELLESVRNPHPQTAEVAEVGLGEWAGWSATGDEQLLDAGEGIAVRWSAERGWTEAED